MKKSILCGAVAAGMLLCACSQEEDAIVGGKLLSGIRVSIEDAEFSQTRSSYVVDPALGFVSTWTAGDVIGIYPVGGDQVSFPISEGEGTNTACFDGGAWALRADRQYAAYFPFSASNYTVSESAIPVSYVGQAQSGNASTAHLGQYDYMAAAAVQPNGTGSVDLQMKHLGAFVRYQLTMPKAATLVGAQIESDGEQFVTAGSIDLTAAKPAISATSRAASFSLALSNLTCAADEVVTLYAMVAPASLGSSELTITLTDNAGKTYKYVTAGSNYTAGKSYSYTITETSGGTGATIPDAGWDTSGHEYVDLGLSVKWATCNVGASAPEEYGDYFAWGETEPYYTEGHSQDSPCSNWKSGKSGYNWSNYKYCNNGSWTGMTKYTYPDGQTDGIWYSGSSFIGDNKTVLESADDAATANWGGSWRMPTRAEQDELRTNCTWTWTTLNGVNGYNVKGPNGNSIFLPAAGYRYDGYLYNAGSYGFYWSSSLFTSGSYYAYELFFNSSSQYRNYYSRCNGQSVRPVCQ